MTVEVKLFDDLDAVARDADGALDRAHTPALFDRLDWFRLTLAHCPPPGTPLIARAAQGKDRAWLFLMNDGGRARALASWYTLDYRPVVRAADGDTLLAAIAEALRRRRIATITLAPLLEPDGLAAAFRQAGWRTRQRRASTNWRLHSGGIGFAEYWAQRPGHLRATVRRKAASSKQETLVSSDFSNEIWSEYEQVYAASWKPAEGAPGFLRALAEAEAAAGTLRLGIARVENRPIAAQLWLVENGVATIHKLAHVAAADALSPGTLLSAAMFRSVLDQDRPEWISFGTGDDRYKADWMDDPRPLYELELFNPSTLTGLVRAGKVALGSLVRPGGSG